VRRATTLPRDRRLVDERLGPRVETREAKGQAAEAVEDVRLEADDASLAAEDRLTRRKHQLEAQHDALGPRLGTEQGHARARERLELLL